MYVLPLDTVLVSLAVGQLLPGKGNTATEGLLPEGFDGLYIPRRVEDGDWSSIRRARSARRAEVYDR